MIANFDVGELLGDLADGLLLEEADGDHEVVALEGVLRDVGDVVAVRLRDRHVTLDAVLLLGLLEALAGEEVERLVAETGDVGDETDLDVRAAAGLAGLAVAVVVAMADIATAASSIAARGFLVFSGTPPRTWTGRMLRDVRMPRIVSVGPRSTASARRARIAARRCGHRLEETPDETPAPCRAGVRVHAHARSRQGSAAPPAPTTSRSRSRSGAPTRRAS